MSARPISGPASATAIGKARNARGRLTAMTNAKDIQKGGRELIRLPTAAEAQRSRSAGVTRGA